MSNLCDFRLSDFLYNIFVTLETLRQTSDHKQQTSNRILKTMLALREIGMIDFFTKFGC